MKRRLLALSLLLQSMFWGARPTLLDWVLALVVGR